MYQKRTDLAEELLEISGKIDGVRVEEFQKTPVSATILFVETEEAGQRIGKDPGKYITLDLSELWDRHEERFEDFVTAVANCLSLLLPQDSKEALVVGIGNRRITPDSIGPACIDSVMVTRHLISDLPELFGNLKPVSAISPGVLGLTGVETGEIVLGLCERLKPDVVIAVDALASRRMSRLLRTIQFTDTGISPGSGVGNDRFPLSPKTLRIPCIALGVPTVVDAGTLTADVLEESGLPSPGIERIASRFASLMVTPREIDAEAAVLSRILGYGINMALQPGLSCADITAFLN